jgi:hypothetical protein
LDNENKLNINKRLADNGFKTYQWKNIRTSVNNQ